MASAAAVTEGKDKVAAAAGVAGWASVTCIFLSAFPLLFFHCQK